MLTRVSQIFPGVGPFCLGGLAFAEKFCAGAGLLITLKKIQGGEEGCWHLELTDALCPNTSSPWNRRIMT